LEEASERAKAGSLDVKEKRREKTLLHLGNLSALGGFQSRYAAAVHEEGQLLSRLRALGVTNRLVEQKRALHQAEQSLEEARKRLVEAEKQVPDATRELAELQEHLSVYAGCPVTVKV